MSLAEPLENEARYKTTREETSHGLALTAVTHRATQNQNSATSLESKRLKREMKCQNVLPFYIGKLGISLKTLQMHCGPVSAPRRSNLTSFKGMEIICILTHNLTLQILSDTSAKTYNRLLNQTVSCLKPTITPRECFSASR